MKHGHLLHCLFGLVLLLHGSAASSDWPSFRGPDASGVSDGKDLPDRWSTTEGIAWSIAIPGLGWSSPITWRGKVFLTTAVNEAEDETPKKGLYFGGNRLNPPSSSHRWVVLAIDAGTGKVLWEKTAHRGTPQASRHLKNTFASETPVTDGERVYAYFGNLGIFTYDLDGNLVWSQNFPPRKTRDGWGTAASPVLHDGRLYIVNDNEEQSFLAAFEARTGKEVWRVDRDEKSNWATPFVWKNPTRTEIVTVGTGGVRAYDLDGKPLWNLRGMSSITIPSPFAKDGLLYAASGFVMDKNRPVYAIRPGAAGDISLKEGETSSTFIAWSDRQAAPYNPSLIAHGDHLYVLLDRGFLACYELKTGKVVYDKVRLGEAAAFTASPWAYDGKVFCLSEDGDTYVIRAGAKFELLATNSLGEMCMATPAVAGGALYLRTLSKLYRIGGKAEGKN
jgi:hypothetical protein